MNFEEARRRAWLEKKRRESPPRDVELGRIDEQLEDLRTRFRGAINEGRFRAGDRIGETIKSLERQRAGILRNGANGNGTVG